MQDFSFFMAPYGWDSTTSRSQSHYEETVYFLPQVPRSSRYSLNWPRKDERLSRPWRHCFWTQEPWIGNPVFLPLFIKKLYRPLGYLLCKTKMLSQWRYIKQRTNWLQVIIEVNLNFLRTTETLCKKFHNFLFGIVKLKHSNVVQCICIF